MVDIKKPIVVFLLFAAIAGLVALSLNGSPASKKGPRATALQPNPVPQNAFLARTENMPIALRPNLSGKQTNLTEGMAKSLAEVIVALNPDGPKRVGQKTGFVMPTTTVLLGYLLMDKPDFRLSDLWSSPEANAITFAGADDAAAGRAYAQSFREIVGGTVSNPDFLAQLKSGGGPDADPAFAANFVPVFSDAIRKLGALAVPPSFTEFHKKFLTYLMDQRNVLAVLVTRQADPMKSLVVLNSSEEIGNHIGTDLGAASDAYNRLDHSRFLSLGTEDPEKKMQNPWSTVASAIRGLGENIFSIPTANALSLGGSNPESKCGSNFIDSLKSFFSGILSFFFKVPTTDSAASKSAGGGLNALLIDCQSRILTQQTKAGLVNIMNAKTLQYIQGANSQGGLGDPRFITNFNNYFATAVVQGATKAYRDITPDVCPEFQQYVDRFVFNPNDITAGRVANNDVYLSQDTIVDASGISPGSSFGKSGINGVPTGCQLPNKVDTTAYYNDFNSDPNKWEDYFALFTDPTDNPWGTIAGSHDAIDITAGSYAAAANTESISNQGNQADVQCTDAITLDDGTTICLDQQIKTPGSVIASESNAAINSGLEAVVNANDLADIDSELADSLSNQLFTQPQQGLSALKFQLGGDLSSVCQSLSVPGLGNNPALGACNNMLGKITAQFNKYVNILQTIQSIMGLFF